MNKLVLLTVAVAFSAVSFGTTTVASVQNTPVYYLSLGDSLSVGIQPNQSDLHRPFPFIGAGGFGGALSREGFSDQLAAIKRQTISNLHLVKLGCNGESTSSMIARPAELPGQTDYGWPLQLSERLAAGRRRRVPRATFRTGRLRHDQYWRERCDPLRHRCALSYVGPGDDSNEPGDYPGKAPRSGRTGRTNRGNELLLDGYRRVVRESCAGAGDREPHRAGERRSRVDLSG